MTDPRAGEPREPAAGELPSCDAPELDPLFAMARSIINRPSDVDVDRVLAVGAARAEERRSRRLALLRAAGLSLVLGVLLGWVVVARPAGPDILMVVVLFAIPAVVVFRWHLEAMDGCGVLPRRVPPTVHSCSHEVVRQVADLDRSVTELARLGTCLDALLARLGHDGGHDDGTRQFRDVLAVPAEEAREDIRDLVSRLHACSAGSDRFRMLCECRPGDVDWTLMRSADPGAAREQMERVVAALSRLAALASTSTPTLPLPLRDDAPAGPEPSVEDLRSQAERLLPAVAGRLRTVVRAMDRLHRVASVREMRRAPGTLRPTLGGLAVLVSGVRRPAVQRAAIRAVLVGDHPGGAHAWVRAVMRARTAVGESGA